MIPDVLAQIPDLGTVGAAPIISDNAVIGLLTLLVTTIGALFKNSKDTRAQMAMLKLQHENDAADRAAKAQENKDDREAKAQALREQMSRDADTVRLQLELAQARGQLAAEANAKALRDQVDMTARDTATRLAETAAQTKADVAGGLNRQTDKILAGVAATVDASVVATTGTQTDKLTTAIDDVGTKAAAAQVEANGVNAKIAALNDTNIALANVLRDQGQALRDQGAVLTQLLGAIERRSGEAPGGPHPLRRRDDERRDAAPPAPESRPEPPLAPAPADSVVTDVVTTEVSAPPTRRSWWPKL